MTLYFLNIIIKKNKKDVIKMARTNHKNFHKKLTDLGYNIFILDYSNGSHTYQYEKEGDMNNEYSVDTKKKIIRESVNSPTYKLLKEYYESQGYIVKGYTE